MLKMIANANLGVENAVPLLTGWYIMLCTYPPSPPVVSSRPGLVAERGVDFLVGRQLSFLALVNF